MASDNVGVTEVTWVNDRGGSGAATGTTSWSAANVVLQSGSNEIAVTARDAAGNTQSATINVTYSAPVADTQAPTAPGNLVAEAVSATQINLRWNAATDNTGVDHYDVFRDAVAIGSTANREHVDAAAPSTTYAYTVKAVDAAGNVSVASNVATVTTPASSGGGRPTSPPARICGNAAILDGPSTPPASAIVVPAGNNADAFNGGPGTTYWLAAGVHTLGAGEFAQIVPQDNTVFIGAPGAILDGQNTNRYAFTQHARNVTIEHLTIRNFGTGLSNNDEGVVNHDSGEDWTITHNTVIDNDGAGVFIGSANVIAYNCLKNNGQYGFSSYAPEGIRNVVLDHNEIVGNNTDDWERLRDGCGCTGGGKFWDTHGAVVTRNWVHDNRGTGLWADNNNSTFLFEGNYVESNDGVGLFYEVSYNFMVRDNTFIRNSLVGGKAFADRGDSFPNGAIYISESGGDVRAGSQYAQSEIAGNYFEDNWDGVVLWENADRFCRPDEAFDTTNGCPFFDQTWGTRYKTQNIRIHDNEFRVDKAAIGCTNAYCGRMAVFSNYGTYPANSPYKGNVIREAITFEQNNEWSNNKYVGPWRFVPYETDRNVSFDEWRNSPYNQDSGSSKE